MHYITSITHILNINYNSKQQNVKSHAQLNITKDTSI